MKTVKEEVKRTATIELTSDDISNISKALSLAVIYGGRYEQPEKMKELSEAETEALADLFRQFNALNYELKTK